MFKEVDVIFFVEHKDRELESIQIIAQELKKRNISSLIIPVYFGLFWTLIYRAKLYVSYGIFFEKQFPLDIIKLYIKNGKFLSMNWEEYLSPYNFEFKKPRDIFTRKEVYHIAWDENFYNFLVQSGVHKENIKITGNMLDYLLYQYNKDKKSKIHAKYKVKYHLEKYEKILFFPMNLAWAFFEDYQINFRLSTGYDEKILYEHLNLAKEYRKILLDWITNASKKFEKCFFVIRPHPSISEKQYEDFIIENYGFIPNNILITKEDTIKEWIVISDKIYSNWSTSVKDASNIGKDIGLLTPIERPKWLNVSWNDVVKNIKTIDDFIKDIQTVNLLDTRDSQLLSVIPKNYVNFMISIINNEYSIIKFFPNLFRKIILKQIFKNILCKYFKCSGVKNTKYDYFKVEKYA